MSLITLDEALDLPLERANALFETHLNRYLLRVFKILGFSEMDIVGAEGTVIHLRDGRRILDFSGGIGICGVGHNHPRVLAAERACQERKVIDLLRLAPHPLQGALAHNIAQCLPAPLDVSFFTVSGAEAVEGAMKLCERIQGPKGKTKFIAMQGAFHGKLHGSLSITTASRFQEGFIMGVPPEHVVTVPYGDAAAVAAAIRDATTDGANDIIAVIVEPIRGEACEVPPVGYLTEIARICRENDVMTIFDEVKTGMGRTGRFAAFMHEDVVPDVTTLAKSLGGAKRAVGAMVTSQENWDKAYGRVKDCTLHSTGFGGLGSTMAVALETINIMHDEGLIERCAELGEYFGGRLRALQERHPKTVAEVRGRGLFQALRFRFKETFAARVAGITGNEIFRSYQSVMIGALSRELYTRHDVLTHFQPGALDILHFMPPLVVEKEEIDRVVDALDDILTRGMTDATVRFVTANARRVMGL
ncbi:aspartate aminotransferase family protein [Gaopeijia maritima]|uniref:Aminotransferase class III-fold pyridoxal phosphate-dependent enzyme n=1 Tax=Gaopeijia maritima TaxID=3119007 RepID=A0ABU9E595_9BACT